MKTVKTFSLLFFTAQSSLHPPVKKSVSSLFLHKKSTIREPTLTNCF